MVKSNIRKISLAILLIFMYTVFVGCAANKKEGDNYLDINVNALEPAELVFYFPGSAVVSMPRADTRTVLDEIEKKAANLNIKLNFNWVNSTSYFSTIKTLLESGGKIDAFCIGKPDRSLDFSTLMRTGLIKDISDSFPKTAPGLYKRYNRDDLASTSVDGKLGAIPSISPQAYVTTAFIQNTFVDKYGIKDINTYEEFGEVLRKLKENEPDIVPGYISSNELNMFSSVFDYITLDPNLMLLYKQNDPDMKVIAWEQTPEFKKVLADLSVWYREKLLYIAGATAPSAKMIGGGITYMEMITGVSNRGTWSFGAGNIAEVTYFRLYKDKKVQRSSTIDSVFSRPAIAFPTKSPNTDRVLMFLDWINRSQDNYELLMYGIKDKDYVIKGETVALPDGMDYDSSRYMYWTGSQAFRNVGYERSPLVKEMVSLVESNTKYAPHEGFYPDYTQIKALADYRQINLSRSLGSVLTTQGTFKPEDIDTIIESFGRQGTNTIVAEVQKQLNAWRGSNKK